MFPLIPSLVLVILLAASLWLFIRHLLKTRKIKNEISLKAPAFEEILEKEIASSSENLPFGERTRIPKRSFGKAISSWIPLLQAQSKDLARWEQVLIESDLGPRLTTKILEEMKTSPETPATFLKMKLFDLINQAEVREEPWLRVKPWVLFLVGVNGVGKTTTIVKLAHYFLTAGKSVGVLGADTFRKAATEQLERGCKRVGADFFTLQSGDESEGADPGAVVFDGLRRFLNKEIILVDTSGRLHTKKNLMEELKKMLRVAGKSLEGAPHDKWIIMDATLGQNSVGQAKVFHEAVGLTGVILTKVDGLSRGGTIFQLFQELHVPIRFLGLGEQPEDLEIFHSQKFIEELFDQARASS